MSNVEENNNDQLGEEAQPWLMTYADMMTLLFAFFVLLYSMSSPDPVKMSAMEDAIAKEAGIEGELKSQNEIKEDIEDIIENLDLQNTANVIKDPRGVAIELDGDICFSSGSTNIQGRLKTVLNNVATEVLTNPNDYRMVIVEGHTDSQPIPKNLKSFFPTNWELSAARASSVVNYLISQGVNSGRLQASGYADRWPAEVSWFDVRSGKVNDQVIKEQNKTQKQMNKNRRIKIVFTND
tara:strand:+ start:581 stop:1294 length:714 start_codon:yes stop_codon:yes gene_type:complete